MSYLAPKEVAEIFSITERTVYNRINKHANEIRVRKQDGKTLVDEESFSEAYLKKFPKLGKFLSNNDGNSNQEKDGNRSEGDSEFQEKYQTALQEITSLKKYNSNLQEIANDRAIMLTEVKSEKAELSKKYDALQTDFIGKIESFSEEKEKLSVKVSKRAMRYYFLLGICFILLLVIVWGYFSGMFDPGLEN